MTSNQLNYWKLQEEERSNRAKEAETHRSNLAKEAETYRSNVASESIKQVSNALEERGLDIKDKQLLTQLAELYIEKGRVDFNSLSKDMQKKLLDAYDLRNIAGGDDGFDEDYDFGTFLSDLGSEFKKIFGSRGMGVIKALF